MLPENWPIVQWFLQVDDLFRYEQSICLGLDIPALHSEAQMSARRYSKEQFQGLRLMARTAANELNQRH